MKPLNLKIMNGLNQMHVDNTEDFVGNVSRKIVDFIKQRK